MQDNIGKSNTRNMEFFDIRTAIKDVMRVGC